MYAGGPPKSLATGRAASTGASDLTGRSCIVTPRLGRPIQPAHVESIDPWWREAGRWREQPADAAPPTDASPAVALPASLGERAVDELNAH